MRVAPDIKLKIERAAILSGQSISDFVLGATVRQAQKVIHDAEVIDLSATASIHFLDALDRTAAKPNSALLKAAKRHREATR
jgi:uncharacterized protein (DUF1778 family)